MKIQSKTNHQHWIAGALDESLSVGDMLISNDVVYHDVDATAFGYKLGQIPQMPLEFKSDQELLKSVETVINKIIMLKLAKLLAVIALLVVLISD